MRLFLDTSIFVDVLRTVQAETSKSVIKSLQEGNEGFTSAIAVAELSVPFPFFPFYDRYL